MAESNKKKEEPKKIRNFDDVIMNILTKDFGKERDERIMQMRDAVETLYCPPQSTKYNN